MMLKISHLHSGALLFTLVVVEFYLAYETSFWQNSIPLPVTIVFFVALAVTRLSIRLF